MVFSNTFTVIVNIYSKSSTKKVYQGEEMYELALFAGAGGGILGGMLCGRTIVGAVEIEEYPREVLKQGQRDGVLDKFPIWDDVTTFREDNLNCREYIEGLKEIRHELTISGGFPCQDISAAGKGAGINETTRSGLWFEFARIINEIRPARVLVENSPMLTVRGLGVVLGSLAEMGYNAKWGVLGAVDVGAPHKRERIWIVADSNIKRAQVSPTGKLSAEQLSRGPGEKKSSNWWAIDPADVADSKMFYAQRRIDGSGEVESGRDYKRAGENDKNRPIKSRVGRVAYGVANRVDRLKSIGNGQVPPVVYAIEEILG